jgi:nitrile hydratase
VIAERTSTMDARREVAELVCDLPGGRPGELAFEEPWELRAFALAVTAHKAGRFPWSEFQGALIESITAWEAAHPTLDDPSWSYYEHWVAALEKVLGDAEILDSADLDRRVSDVLATPASKNHHEAHVEPIAVDAALRT